MSAVRDVAHPRPAPSPEDDLPRPVWALFGAFLLVPVVLTVVALDALSAWGWAWWLSTATLAVGLVSAPWRRRRAWGPTRTGALAVVIVAVLRLVAGGVSPDARLLVLPHGDEAPWLDRLFEERDATIVGARLLSGVASAEEFPTLAPLLVPAYDAMEIELGHRMGSHVLTTALVGDRGDAFAAFVVEPDTEARGSVVFLHGTGGNLFVLCWQVAVAARAAGLRTVCPSTGFASVWSRSHGERIARAAIGWARRGDVTILAGLSGGAIGASRLAPRLSREIDALVLLSGADPRADDPEVPTLIVQGARDGMMPARLARGYRDAHPTRVHYVELEATHFMLLERSTEVRAELTRFFLARRDAYEAERGR